MKKTDYNLLFAGLLLFSFAPAAFSDSPDMYSMQKRSSTSPKPVSITYAVEVIRNGKISNVPDNYAFKKGDDVRFHVQSNTDGYMYILASGADGGQYDLIYPQSGSNEKELKKGQNYHLPEQGVKVQSSGNLKSVKLVFSKTKLDTDDTRSMTIIGISQPPPLMDTAPGTPANENPPGFDGELAKTLVLAGGNKPLGVEISLTQKNKQTEQGKKSAQ